jgi:HD-like signal output (HDOD) protein
MEEQEDDGEAEQLRSWLERFLDTPALVLPRPPTVALEIYELSRRSDTDIGKIAQLLGREPMLAASVLKLANSPLYRGDSPSATLKHALTRVGLAAARDIVMEAAMRMTILRAEGMSQTLERIRRHSTGVAWLSRAVARNTPLEAEHAFLVGLLHHIGLAVGLVGTAEYLRQRRLPVQLTASRWLTVDQLHPALGQRVLESWGVGAPLAFTVGHHHTLMIEAHPHPGVAVLLVAQSLAADHGWHVSPVTEEDDPLGECVGPATGDPFDTERALQALNLTQRHYELLRKDAGPMLETLDTHFRA